MTSTSKIQYESQELSGIDIPKALIDSTEIVPVALDSFPSSPSARIDVPEVSDFKASFVYNFFTANEREIINNGSRPIDASISRSEEVFFEERNERLPRYVKFQFKPPVRTTVISELRNSRIVSENIDKVVVEGGTSNSDFLTFELVDSLKEKHLYSVLDGAVVFNDLSDSNRSSTDDYKNLLDTNSDGRLTGREKELIVSAIKSMQSKGYKLSRTDIRPEDAETADDLVSRQNFSIQMNKLIFDQAIQSALRIPDSVFQDEFSEIKSLSSEIQNNAIKTNSSNEISESDYSAGISPVEIRNFSRDNNSESYPIIKHAGYVIKKLELLGNGLYEERGKIVSDNPDGLYIIDKDVRYGGVYTYEIRTVYYVQAIIDVRDPLRPANDYLGVASFLVASQGKLASVSCVEDVPPPPPECIRISFDYKTRKPRVNWQFPVNPQRDIKRFQIFKRLNVNQPFTLLAEYDFDNSTIRTSVAEIASPQNLYKFENPKINFIDNTWKEGEKPIYAVACVDAHGLSSNLSTQMRFDYDSRLNKVNNILVSYPNAPKPYPNILLNNDSFEDAIKISGYNRMKIFLDPEYFKVTQYIDKNPNEIKDLNFLRIDPNKDTYKIHMINIDNQKDKILNVRIANFSGDPTRGTIQS